MKQGTFKFRNPKSLRGVGLSGPEAEIRNFISGPDIYAVFGNPVAHSLSPLMHQDALSRLSLKAQYVPFCVQDLFQAVQGIRGMDIRGVSITLPFKTEVMKYLDEIEESALQIGAVNTIWNHQGRLKGYNTDWLGFVLSLKEVMAIKGRRFAVLGAGGAARAVLYGLIQEGGIPILLNRTLSKAQALAHEFCCFFEPWSGMDGLEAYCLINTTSLGLAPQSETSPCPKKFLPNFEWVVDIIYIPLETRLLREAREAGCKTLSGLGMFVHQGAEQLRIWTAMDPPRSFMWETVRERLTKQI